MVCSTPPLSNKGNDGKIERYKQQHNNDNVTKALTTRDYVMLMTTPSLNDGDHTITPPTKSHHNQPPTNFKIKIKKYEILF